MGVFRGLGELNNIEFRCIFVSIVSVAVILLAAKDIGAVLTFGYLERRKERPVYAAAAEIKDHLRGLLLHVDLIDSQRC